MPVLHLLVERLDGGVRLVELGLELVARCLELVALAVGRLARLQLAVSDSQCYPIRAAHLGLLIQRLLERLEISLCLLKLGIELCRIELEVVDSVLAILSVDVRLAELVAQGVDLLQDSGAQPTVRRAAAVRLTCCRRSAIESSA